MFFLLLSCKLQCETVCGVKGERLSTIHEARQSAETYVLAIFLAAKMAEDFKSLVWELAALLFGNDD